MSKELPSDAELAGNRFVDRDLLKELNEILERLRALGIETQGRYRVVHPFDEGIAAAPGGGEGRPVVKQGFGSHSQNQA